MSLQPGFQGFSGHRRVSSTRPWRHGRARGAPNQEPGAGQAWGSLLTANLTHQPRTAPGRQRLQMPLENQRERRNVSFLNFNPPGKRVPTAKAPLQVRRALSRWGIIDVLVSLEQHRLFSPEPQETLELEKAGNHHKESSGRHSAHGSRLFLLLSTKKT